MKSTPVLSKIPARLERTLARKASANHRTVEGEILHRLERSVAEDAAEEKLGAHLRRALAAEQVPMNSGDVLAWAEETCKPRERPADWFKTGGIGTFA